MQTQINTLARRASELEDRESALASRVGRLREGEAELVARSEALRRREQTFDEKERVQAETAARLEREAEETLRHGRRVLDRERAAMQQEIDDKREEDAKRARAETARLREALADQAKEEAAAMAERTRSRVTERVTREVTREVTERVTHSIERECRSREAARAEVIRKERLAQMEREDAERAAERQAARRAWQAEREEWRRDASAVGARAEAELAACREAERQVAADTAKLRAREESAVAEAKALETHAGVLKQQEMALAAREASLVAEQEALRRRGDVLREEAAGIAAKAEAMEKETGETIARWENVRAVSRKRHEEEMAALTKRAKALDTREEECDGRERTMREARAACVQERSALEAAQRQWESEREGLETARRAAREEEARRAAEIRAEWDAERSKVETVWRTSCAKEVAEKVAAERQRLEEGTRVLEAEAEAERGRLRAWEEEIAKRADDVDAERQRVSEERADLTRAISRQVKSLGLILTMPQDTGAHQNHTSHGVLCLYRMTWCSRLFFSPQFFLLLHLLRSVLTTRRLRGMPRQPLGTPPGKAPCVPERTIAMPRKRRPGPKQRRLANARGSYSETVLLQTTLWRAQRRHACPSRPLVPASIVSLGASVRARACWLPESRSWRPGWLPRPPKEKRSMRWPKRWLHVPRHGKQSGLHKRQT